MWLEEQAFVDGLDPGQAALRESPAPSGRPMQARSPPVPELQRARNDGRQLVAATGESADALQRVRGELLLGRELGRVGEVLYGAPAAAIDDGAGRLHARLAPLHDPERARPLEPALSGELRLNRVAGSGRFGLSCWRLAAPALPVDLLLFGDRMIQETGLTGWVMSMIFNWLPSTAYARVPLTAIALAEVASEPMTAAVFGFATSMTCTEVESAT